jgi:phosphatidylserine/phosphatidylglycerophosphate/cardiolipin synthase-like enzyme
MPIVGSKLVVREAGWSSNSNREDNPENRSAYASGPFDLKRPEESLKVGQREVPRLAQGIVEALVRTKERGVDVRLIADRTTPCERESGIEPLAAAGVPVWIDAQARVAHAKAMVIDGAVTLTGSMNWTRGAAVSSEDLNLISSPAVAAAYTAHWHERLALSVRFDRREDWCRVSARP